MSQAKAKVKTKTKSSKDSKQLLVEAVSAVIKRLERTEKFVLEQAPDVAKDAVKEGLFDQSLQLSLHVFYSLITGSILAGCLYRGYQVMVNACTKVETITNGYSGGVAGECLRRASDELGPNIFALVLGVIMLLAFLCSIENAVSNYTSYWTIKNCPKLFLLRKFKELLE